MPLLYTCPKCGKKRFLSEDEKEVLRHMVKKLKKIPVCDKCYEKENNDYEQR